MREIQADFAYFHTLYASKMASISMDDKSLDEIVEKICKTLPICQGSCPYQTIDKNSGPVCDYSKYLIENTLNKACTYIKDNKGI